MARLNDPTRAAAYAALIPGITKVAKEFGYCTAIHGSMSTDLDIVLIPWVETASEPGEVVEAIRLLMGGRKGKHAVLPEKKALGRLAWSFYLTEEGANSYGGQSYPYVDISVTPRGAHPEEEDAS
jgi:hypothetical protein